MSKVIVIGGGASGLVAAIYASLNNEVIVLEKNSKCGKKILATGNGKCNYWNSNFSPDYFNCDNKDILNKIISQDNQNKIMEFFNNIGIVSNIKDGYYYPISNQAISIRESLVKEAINKGVKIITDCSVFDVDYNNNYVVKTNKGNYISDKLIISTGSHAWIKDKSIGYDILKKLGHSINSVVPALVQLVSSNPIKKANGVRIDCNLSLYEDGIKVTDSYGEAQITDYGISGICTLNLSSIVSRGLILNKKEEIHINFVPWINNDFINYMNKRNNVIKNRTISELFDGMMNYKLSNALLEICGIKLDDKWEHISDSKKNEISNLFTDFVLKICDTKGFSNAQTCSGGISLTEINPNTMESIKVKNLYITGELIDVDGLCGGYNLGFAWLTGMIAGSSLNDKN